MKKFKVKKLISLLLAAVMMFSAVQFNISVVTASQPNNVVCADFIIENANCFEIEFLTRTLRGNFGIQGFEGDYALGNDPNKPVEIYV